jgi:hypothetical protein
MKDIREQIIEIAKTKLKEEYYTDWVHEEPHSRSRTIGYEEFADAILKLFEQK